MFKKSTFKEFYDGLVHEGAVQYDVVFSSSIDGEFKIASFGDHKDAAFSFCKAQPCSFIVYRSIIHQNGFDHE